MDIPGSEWSSGCESGWTGYLDESSLSPNNYQRSGRRSALEIPQQSYRSNADYEEDLSMVSDASSGPPHFQYGAAEKEEEVKCYRGEKKKKKAKESTRAQNQHSFLDDTASSPALGYPVSRCMDPSSIQPSMDHLYSFSHGNGFTGNSAYGNQFGFWQSSQPKPQDSTESSRSRGRRRG